MTGKNTNGLYLRESQVHIKADRVGTSLIACLSSISVGILFICLMGGGGSLWLTMSVISAVMGFLYGWSRHRSFQKWLYPTILCLLLLIVFVFGGNLSAGVGAFRNRLNEIWIINTGRMIAQPVAWDEGTSLFPFYALTGIGISLLCCVALDIGAPILSLCLSAVGIGFLCIGGDGISQGWVLPAFLTAGVCLLWGGEKESKLHTFFRFLPMVLICTILLTAVAGLSESISEEIKGRLHTKKYETGYTTLPEGDLSNSYREPENPQPALVVSMTIPETLYLRGFTGNTFQDNRWYETEPTLLAENKELLYWLNLQEFHLQAQYEKAAQGVDIPVNTITVQNIGACSSYRYVPFSQCMGQSLDPLDLRTDGLRSKGERIYLYSAISGGTDGSLKTLEYLQNSEEEWVLSYRQAEQAYRAFIKEHYLQIPETVKTVMEPYWTAAKKQQGDGELAYEQALRCVSSVLERCFREDGEAPQLPADTVKGTAFQYATVATMTLRYFGIPARYAEGYVIPVAYAKNAKDGMITVDSSCATAWVEIYQDGLGWIPGGLLPGAEGLLPDPNSTGEAESKLPNKPPMEEGQELEEQEEHREEPDGGYTFSIPTVMSYGTWILVALPILLILGILLRRRLLCSRRSSKFHSENQKDAIGWIFADAMLLLSKMGLERGNGSFHTLIAPAREQLGEAYAIEMEAMICLNEKMLFSSIDPDGDEINRMGCFYDETRRMLHGASKWYEKLWMQYILCVY